MTTGNSPKIYRAIILITLIAGLTCFLYRAIDVVFLFAMAAIAATALNFPVRWLEKKKWKRLWAVMFVCFVCAAISAGIILLVIPILSEQISALSSNFPAYVAHLDERVTALMKNNPQYSSRIRESLSQALSALPDLLGNTLKLSFSLVAGVIFGALFLSIVVYMLLDPRPFLKFLLEAVPEKHRESTAATVVQTARTIASWVASCVVIGGVEALIALPFLLWLGVPGAMIWAVLALFSEIIPRLGFYLMAIPPTIVAMSALSFSSGLWVLLFYVGLNEVMSNTLAPWIRSRGMNINPVSCLFITLAMGAVFGLPGAIVALPLAGLIKGVYQNFYMKYQPSDSRVAGLVEEIMDA